MSSLFDVGKSAIQSYRQSLAVTGQNIANINTEGYVRREAALEEVAASQGGINTLANQAGLGVRVSDIRRSFDEFLTSRKLSATAEFQKLNEFVDQLGKAEEILLPTENDLGEIIGDFFRSLSAVAASPTDLAPRAVAVQKGQALSENIQQVHFQLHQLKNGAKSRAEQTTSEFNALVDELKSLNSKILSAGQSGKTPNSLLDLRDSLVEKISTRIGVSVSYSDRGTATISLGSSGIGPDVLRETTSTKVGTLVTGGRLQVVLSPGSSNTPTSQADSGLLGGLVSSYAGLDDILGDLNSLVGRIANEVNAQHRLGLTLDGRRGGDMFSSAEVLIEPGLANPAGVSLTVDILDYQDLPQEQFNIKAKYDKQREVWALIDAEGEVLGSGKHEIIIDNFKLNFFGNVTSNAEFQLSFGSGNAGAIEFLITRPEDIAAGSPDMISAATTNRSSAEIILERVDNYEYPTQKTVDQVFVNSSSPVEATEFIKDGFVGVIPSGTEEVNLASFTKQATARFSLTSLGIQNVSQLNISRSGSDDDGPFTFNISYGDAFPGAPVGTVWSDLGQIAELLNNGTLRSSGVPAQSFSDLGLVASGSGGQLTIASSTGNFSGNPTLLTGLGNNEATVSDAISASDIQILTREGKHIAGTALTQAQIANFLTEENGFGPEFQYDARYLNNIEDAYRGLDLKVAFDGGVFQAEFDMASASGGNSIVPGSALAAQTVSIAASNGESYSVPLQDGQSAYNVALALNKSLSTSGVKAEAKTRVELYSFNAGLVSFDLEAKNIEPVTISAEVTASNISNLASAINKMSNQTGVVAHASATNQSLILESADGEDIAISAVNSSAPTFSARLVNRDSEVIAGVSAVDINSTGLSGRVDTARFTGSIYLSSAGLFSITDSGGTATASQNSNDRGGVTVTTNASGDVKRVIYDLDASMDVGGPSLDGLKAVAGGSAFGLTVPTSDPAIVFTASVSANEVGDLTRLNLNRKIVSELRSDAPVISMSGGGTASIRQVQTFSFNRSEAPDASFDTTNIEIDGISVPVSLAGVTTNLDVATAIANAVNGLDLGLTAVASADTGVTPNVVSVTLTSDIAGKSFAVNSFQYVDASELVSQPQFTLSQDVTARGLPADGSSLALNYAGQTYTLIVKNGEIDIQGGEPGRLNAYFDADGRLQVYGGHSMGGNQITLAADTEISGNSTMAAIFGCDTLVSRTAGIEVGTPNAQTLTVRFDGVDYVVSLSGSSPATPNSSPALDPNLTMRWQENSTIPGNGKLIFEYDSSLYNFEIAKPSEALGFKVADRQIVIDGDSLKISSTDQSAFSITAAAERLAKSSVKMSATPSEDFLVFVTGGGARQISGEFSDTIVTPDLTKYELRAVGDDGNVLEIWDADTGHALATRVVSGDGQTRYGNFEFTVKGKPADGDYFTLTQDHNGAADSRNIEKIIALNSRLDDDATKPSFKEVFGAMIASLGSAVETGKISRDAGEENLLAMKEAESEFAGVNLDAEAAALIEFQQAYQASARILSTARELFQSLIEVV